MRMIYSSNNEESLLKSAGPFRIKNSGTSFAGSVISKGQHVSAIIIHGKNEIFGKLIIPGEPRSSKKKEVIK